jgi:putative spermidine/putrescine transport system ATP-binding protein
MSGLTIRELTKRYGQFSAVQNVDLNVVEGEFVSLLGPSGCGKTTTLRCVAGLEAPTNGHILFGNQDVTGLPPEKRNIGMVFQNYALFPHMTVAENVGFGLDMRGIRGAAAASRVNFVMEMVQLGGYHARHPRELSGGQQQRVALARALVVEPALLLLDEPLANLDAKLRDEMRFFIRSLQQRVGITTLYVTHDQAEAMTMSDRIVVMFAGRIHQIGSPREVYFRPTTCDVANFIGQSNLFQGKIVTRNGTSASVETSVGLMRCESPPGFEAGARARVMVRPETISLARNGGGLTGRVTRQQFLGNLVDYRLTLADGTIVTVQTMGEIVHEVGDEVSLVIDQNKAWLLP